MPETNSNQIILVASLMLRSMRSPNYRIYLLGSLTQFAPLITQVITGPLLMYRLTGSPALLGVTALVGSIPMIAMSIFGGAIADRISKKKVIIIALLGSIIMVLVIGMLLTTGIISKENPDSWLILLAVMLFLSGLNGMLMPALQALIPEIVEKEELMNAVAVNSLGINALSLMAPAAAGFMIDAYDFNVIYFTMAGLYTCSLIFIVFVRGARQSTGSSGSILGEIYKGLRYVKRDNFLFIILVFTLIATLLSMPYQQLLPIYADDILKVGATGMGMLLSASGAGALVASIVLMALPNKKRGLMLLVSGLVSGLALVGFSFSSTMGISITVMVFIGIAQTFRVTIGSTLLQVYAEPEYRGRVMSLFHIQWGLSSICTFLAGVLSEVAPVQWVLGILSMILVILCLMAIAFISGFRRLD
ncbi:MAG: MFS transporter [Dehalococcoidia bacterium]